MTSEKNNSAKDFLLQLFNKYHSEQQKANQKKIREELRSDMEQYNLRLLELRRTAIENLSGIELERRLKLYDDYESVFKKMNDLIREHVYGDNEKFLREWDSVVNEYKSLLQREKLYEKVGHQSAGQKPPEASGGELPEKLAVQKTTPTKKSKLKPILYAIGGFVGFLAALFTCLGYLLGWLGPIKAFISKILWPK
jgi:hypothetical protein